MRKAGPACDNPRVSDTTLFPEEMLNRLAEMPELDQSDSSAFHNPSKEIQTTFVGASGSHAYQTAAIFLEHVFGKTGVATLSKPKVLDFGCGWGRMLRVLRSAPALDHVECFGCDPNEKILEIDRRTIPGVSLVRSDPLPPSMFRSASFDLVYAFSVFSHLNRFPHLSWAQEFARIVKPSGFVVFTTRQRSFLEEVKRLASGAREAQTKHEHVLAKSPWPADALELYDAGELVFGPMSSYDRDIYGDAAAPKEFVQKYWSNLGFDLIDWTEPPAMQAIVTLRRR